MAAPGLFSQRRINYLAGKAMERLHEQVSTVRFLASAFGGGGYAGMSVR